MPELSWLQRVVDDGRLETPSVVGADGVAQVGLGFLVGGD
jgi:hypothetical protein